MSVLRQPDFWVLLFLAMTFIGAAIGLALCGDEARRRRREKR